MSPAAPLRLRAAGSQRDSHHITREMVGHWSTGHPTANAVAAHCEHGPDT